MPLTVLVGQRGIERGGVKADVRWLISEFLNLRQSGEELVIELSVEASRSLADFSRQQVSRNHPLPQRQQRFAQNAPVIAAKIAGNVQLLSLQRTHPIPGAVMEQAIRMAQRLSATTVKLADILTRRRTEAELAQTAEKMLDFLEDMGRTNRWPLWKRFDKHPKHLMEAALELLLRGGRARSYPDGR